LAPSRSTGRGRLGLHSSYGRSTSSETSRAHHPFPASRTVRSGRSRRLNCSIHEGTSRQLRTYSIFRATSQDGIDQQKCSASRSPAPYLSFQLPARGPGLGVPRRPAAHQDSPDVVAALLTKSSLQRRAKKETLTFAQSISHSSIISVGSSLRSILERAMAHLVDCGLGMGADPERGRRRVPRTAIPGSAKLQGAEDAAPSSDSQVSMMAKEPPVSGEGLVRIDS
jgi:hypothetical protein